MKKEIIVSENNMGKLDAAIREVEGRATARTVSAKKVADELKFVEWNLGIAKKAMEGIKVVACPDAQSFPKAYKYTPMATVFAAVYKGGKWRITDIRREECWRSYGHKVTHTDESRRAILKKHEAF